MPWQSSAQSTSPRPAATVPEGESVRLAALQAAWRRDRWVARRRIWLRWTLWGAQRYGVPAAGVLGVCAALWMVLRATMGVLDAPSHSAPVMAAGPAPAPVTHSTDTTAARVTPANASADSPPKSLGSASGILLIFEPSLHASASTHSPVSSPAGFDADEPPHPPLISENWLHSKEP